MGEVYVPPLPFSKPKSWAKCLQHLHLHHTHTHTHSHSHVHLHSHSPHHAGIGLHTRAGTTVMNITLEHNSTLVQSPFTSTRLGSIGFWAMPAKAAGVHGPRPSMLTRLGLTVEEVDLSGLSSKAFTLLLQGRHEEDAGFKVRRQSRRHVRAINTKSWCGMKSGFTAKTANGRWMTTRSCSCWVKRRRRNSRRMSAQHWKPPRAATLKMRWTGAGSEDEEEDKEAEEETEEDKPPKGPLDACPEPPPLKRLRTKGPSPRPLLELGWKAMIGVADYTSRLATELGCPYILLCLREHHLQTCCVAEMGRPGGVSRQHPVLVGPRERQLLLYGARWTGARLQHGCSRMLLLSKQLIVVCRSSSAPCKRGPCMGHIHCVSEPEIKNAVGVDSRDGNVCLWFISIYKPGPPELFQIKLKTTIKLVCM